MATPSITVTVHQNVDDQSGATKLAYLGVLLFVLVYYLRPSDWIPGTARMPFAKIVAFFAVGPFLLILGRLRRRMPREVIYLVLFLLQLTLTVPLSPVWRHKAFDGVLDFSKVVLITVVMALTVSTFARLRQLIFVQTASVVVIAAVGMLKGEAVAGRLEGAVGGLFGNPNDLAFAIALNFPFVFAFLLGTRKRLRKAAWTVALLTLVYALFQTVSRGGFLILLVAFGVCLWEFAVKGRRRYLLVLTASVGIGFWSLASAQLKTRFEAISHPQEDRSAHGSAEQRQQLFWESLRVTAQHPLFGVGPGNFGVMSDAQRETHNSYTMVSSEGGIPALILYLMIFWRAFGNVRRAKRLAQGQTDYNLLAGALHASLAAYAVGSFFANVAYENFPYLLVAYTTALVQSANADSPSQPAVAQAEYAAGQPAGIWQQPHETESATGRRQKASNEP